jgi:hypothetical protein
LQLLSFFQVSSGVDSTNWTAVKAAFLKSFEDLTENSVVADITRLSSDDKLKQGDNKLKQGGFYFS